jgi:hypothetical protein
LVARETVIELPSAGIPADRGLASLGLVMQLAGTVAAAATTLVAFAGGFVWPQDPVTSMVVFLVIASCFARSLLHRKAGSGLLYARAQPLAGLRRYVVAGLVHAGVVAGVAAVLGAPGTLALALGCSLAVWPAVLAVVYRSIKPLAARIPISEDKGFEGAAILMTVFGACGLLATAAILVALLAAGPHAIEGGGAILLMCGCAMLLARSTFHLQAGVSGLRTTSIDHSVERVTRYASYGVVSGFCAAGALLLVVITRRVELEGLVAVAGVSYLLVAWPLIVRRFFNDRQFADLLAGADANLHRRAPDAGLTGLGWLLLAHAAAVAALLIPHAAGLQAAPAPIRELAALTLTPGQSPWWNVGIVVVEAWAGYELVKMSPYRTIVGILYAIAGGLVPVALAWPFDDPNAVMPIAAAVIVPAIVFVLVTRKLAPSATARFRPSRKQ